MSQKREVARIFLMGKIAYGLLMLLSGMAETFWHKSKENYPLAKEAADLTS